MKIFKNIVIAVLAVGLVLVMVHSCVADNMNLHVVETGTGAKLVLTYNQKQYEVALTPVQNTAANTTQAQTAQSQTAQGSTVQGTQPTAGAPVTLEQAKSIALNDAGLTQAEFTKAKQDYDDGRQVYEIEFRANGKEYEYDIESSTGRILKADTDIYFSLGGGSQTQNTNTAASGITSAEAESIALKDAGIAKANVSYIHTHNDNDDGLAVYDVEFTANSTKYEYTIDRSSGMIRDKDIERR